MTDTPRTDPVTAAVIQGALQTIAIEMGYKLMRMSYSSIIRESEDIGSGILTPMPRATRSRNPCNRRRCSRDRSRATCAT